MRRLLLILFLFCLGCQAHAAEVRVAVAANFLATLKAIAPLYEQQSGDKLIISAGSSGKLYAQIINGAPYDILLAANEAYPEKLEAAGQVVPGSRFVYATGQLVLWSATAQPIDKESVAAAGVKHIAIANPRTAPYGVAARQALESLSLWQPLQAKLVQGESIAQTFQYVASGNVQLGFVALSQVLNPDNSFNRDYYWPVPADAYQPLRQGAALLKQSEHNSAARALLQFLQGDAARKVMANYGYR
jgi:molybdate transport system substrate-binding protein